MARPLADHPSPRRERHAPAAFGADDLRTVEEGVGPPTGLVVLDASCRHLAVYRFENLGLRHDPFRDFLAATDSVTGWKRVMGLPAQTARGRDESPSTGHLVHAR